MILIKLLVQATMVLRPRGPKRIVVIRYDDLGDLLLWLPAAKRLRKAFPKGDWHITLLGKPASHDLNALCPHWDETLDMKTKITPANLFNWLRIFFALAWADILVNPMPNLSKAHLAIFSGAKRKLCFDIKPNEFVPRCPETVLWHNSLHTDTLRPAPSIHILNGNNALASLLTGTEAPLELCAPCFIPDVKPAFSDYLLVAPGGGNPRKRWPTISFAEAARQAAKELGLKRLMICGAQNEEELGDALFALLEDGFSPLNLCGKTSLLELSGLFKYASFVLCNDSGASHLAAIHGTPSIIILGGGHFGSFHPYPSSLSALTRCKAVFHPMNCFNCNWRCSVSTDSDGPFPCISAITVDDVLNAMRQS